MSKHTTISIDDTIDLPQRWEKNMRYQVNQLIKDSGVMQIGVSRHNYVRAQAAEKGIERPDEHQRGQLGGIHSWGTYHKFQSCNITFARFCRAEYGIKNIRQITPQMVSGFLERLSELNYSRNSVNGYITQLEKMASIMPQTAQGWHEAVKEFKSTDAYKGTERKDTSARAYENPRAIVEAISDPKAQVAASLCLDYGLRRGDACHFKLEGDKLLCNSKNGMKTTHTLSPQDAAKIRPYLDEHGRFDMKDRTLSRRFEAACASLRVHCNGIHGLRHNYAQGRYAELRQEGKTTHAARLKVSEEMNHQRDGITRAYLR